MVKIGVKMELKEVINKRRSVRDYKDMPVPEDKLLRILEAARLAPSGSNRQPWKFVVVKDSKTRQKLAKAAMEQTWMAEAPVIIAAVATMPDLMMICGVPDYPVDLAIAVDHMTLAAADEGLGTCWIGAFSQEKVHDILGIPKKYQVVSLLPLGFPNQPATPKARKSLNEIVCYEIFKE
jgi:nitroreductase